jgi:uncharacterized lipoprotein
LLAGCALSPQRVSLTPTINVESQNIGLGQVVDVTVEDNRIDPVVGTRGGVYKNTSTIELNSNLSANTAQAVGNALTTLGFQPNSPLAGSENMAFIVSIDGLTYVPDRSIAGKTTIGAAVSVKVLRGLDTYEGNYTASGEITYLTSPSEEKNRKELNRIFGLALEEIFQDQKLLEFMQ